MQPINSNHRPSRYQNQLTASKTNRLRQAGSFLLPNEKRKPSEILGIIGTALSLAGGAGLVFSPLLAKQARAFASSGQGPKWLLSLANKLSDRVTVEKLFWRLNAIFGFAGGMNHLNTSLNTKQPSLFMNYLAGTVSVTGLLIKPESIFMKSIVYASWALLAMGKQNDIENSNHPDKRREWDLHQLSQPFKKETRSWKSFKHALGEFGHFVTEDFRHMFSIEPWRELSKNYSKKSSWQTPQAYLTAIAGQLFAFSFIATQVAERFKIKNVSPILVPLAGFIYNLPIMFRAWQNRSEPESKAMIAAWPLGIIGDGFRVSRQNNHLSGLSQSGYVTGLGLEINSRRYRKLIEYMNHYYQLAKTNPTLQAKDISTALTQTPGSLKRLQTQIGKSRVQFLLALLKKAQTAQESNIPLAAYLQPIVSPSHHHHARQTVEGHLA